MNTQLSFVKGHKLYVHVHCYYIQFYLPGLSPVAITLSLSHFSVAAHSQLVQDLLQRVGFRKPCTFSKLFTEYNIMHACMHAQVHV